MTPARNGRGVDPSLVRAAVDRARNRLLTLQHGGGYWAAEQEPQAGVEAEEMLFRELMGIRTTEASAGSARWLRSRQRSDGSWGRGGEGDLSVSVLAYIALRLAGDSEDSYHMAMAAGWIRDAGGLAAADVRAKLWLAMIGEAGWDELVVPPPEAVYLPASWPLQTPGQASWARPTAIPAAVIAAVRPVHRLTFNLAELRADEPQVAAGCPGATRGGLDWSVRAFEFARDAKLAPDVGARATALRKCADWLIATQQPDGSFRATGTGWLLSLLALRQLGYRVDHPALASGLARLDAAAVWSQQPDGPARRLAMARPTVLCTAQAVLALADAGLAADDDVLVAAGRWLVAEWASIRAGWPLGLRELTGADAGPELTGKPRAGVDGGAAFAAALGRVRLPRGSGQQPAIAGTLNWLAGLQRRDGGWSWLPPGFASLMTSRIGPRDESGYPASAELTGVALLALSTSGQSESPAAQRAVIWLLRRQLADGPWPGEDGAADLAATCAAVPALVAAGVVPTKPPVTLAAQWLVRVQNPDGGWGAETVSATEPTARALLALLSAGGTGADSAVERGAAWLTLSQRPDGSWDDQHLGGHPALTISTCALARFLAVHQHRRLPGQRRPADEVARTGSSG